MFRVQDEENRRRIDEHYSRHLLMGASMDNRYQINGAGAPFERLFFEARDQLQMVTDDLAFERKDRAYERECLDEWEDFNCIDALLDSQEQLTRAREDLKLAQYEIRDLRDEVRRLKKSSV